MSVDNRLTFNVIQSNDTTRNFIASFKVPTLAECKKLVEGAYADFFSETPTMKLEIWHEFKEPVSVTSTPWNWKDL